MLIFGIGERKNESRFRFKFHNKFRNLTTELPI